MIKQRRFFSFLMLLSMALPLLAQLQTGDPGVTFDQSKFDSDWPQMQRWSQAGVRGGIPLINDLTIVKTISATNSSGINAAITEVSNAGGGTILLLNGNYNINAKVGMKSNVNLLGESRSGVICTINMTDYNGFRFENCSNCGIYRLKIEGGWGTPQYKWNYSLSANDELPNNSNVSIKMQSTASDCWVEQVDIINSALHPLIVGGTHITIRNCYIDGVHRKAGGYQGYFHISNSDNLIVSNQVTHLRHISLQGQNSKYNVVYKNSFEQEVSFHNDDGGNNLIEQNAITLPADMPGVENPNYYAIMGPWSTQHTISRSPNFIYKNSCLEQNNGHNNATPWSDPTMIYDGPYEVKPSDPHTNFRAMATSKVPTGGSLYPVVLGQSGGTSFSETFENMSLSGWGTETYTGNHGIVWNINAKGVSGYIDASKGIYFGNGSVGVTSGTISGGISSFSVSCKDLWSSGSMRTLQLLINGNVVATKTHTGSEVYTFSANNLNVEGDFTLAIKNASSSSQTNTVAIDNIEWTAYSNAQSPYSGVFTVPGIIEAEDFDKGGEGIAYHDATAGNTGGGYRTASDVDIQTCTEGGYNVGWSADGEWLEYTINVPTAANYILEARVASPNSNTEVSVEFEGVNKTGTLSIPNTGAWQNFQTISKTVSLSAGQQVMRVNIVSSGFNFNWVKINAVPLSFSETFANMSLSGWGTESYTGDEGVVWNVNAKGVSGYIDASKGIYFHSGSTGVSSDPIAGGIGSFSVQCKDLWGSGQQRTLQLVVNGNVVATKQHTGTEVYTFAVSNVNISGNVSIGIKNASTTSGLAVAIDNITWTSYAPVQYAPVGIATSVESAEVHEKLNAYPNPFRTQLTINGIGSEFKELSLFDMTGKLIVRERLNGRKLIRLSPSLSHAPKGVYFLQLKSQTNTKTIKVMRD